jgi:hypothetical protein
MLQFYFLSVFANGLAGLTLTADYFGERFSSFAPFKELFSKGSVRVGVGVLAFVVGFLKLLIRSTPTDVPIVGDFLPAVAGLAMGAAIVLNTLRERGAVSGGKVSSLEQAVMSYRVPLGIAGLAVAVLHFLLPGALFL